MQRPVIIVQFYFHATNGYDTESQFMEDIVRGRGYELVYINENQNLIATINRYRNRLVCVAAYMTSYRLSVKYYMKDNGLTTNLAILAYFDELRTAGIKVFPDNDTRNLMDTKLYSKQFEVEHSELYLPMTRTLVNKQDEAMDQVNHLLNMFPSVIVKKGFSSVKRGLVQINHGDDVIEKLRQLDVVRIGKHTMNPAIFEEGSERVTIIQPYNDIVAQRENEYRFLFIGGRYTGYMCRGCEWGKNEVICYPNIRYNEEDPNHIQLMKLARAGFEYASSRINNPWVIRVDVSWSIDPLCQDDHSVVVNGEVRRYYINELEHVPTLYMDAPMDKIRVYSVSKKMPTNNRMIEYQHHILDMLINSLIDKIESS